MKTLNEIAFMKLCTDGKFTQPLVGGKGDYKVRRKLTGEIYTYDLFSKRVQILTHSQLRAMLSSSHIDPVRKAIIQKELKRVRGSEFQARGYFNPFKND